MVARRGVIVNVSSAASRSGSPGEYVDYAASKAAIDTMTIGLANEVAAKAFGSTPYDLDSSTPNFTPAAAKPIGSSE